MKVLHIDDYTSRGWGAQRVAQRTAMLVLSHGELDRTTVGRTVGGYQLQATPLDLIEADERALEGVSAVIIEVDSATDGVARRLIGRLLLRLDAPAVIAAMRSPTLADAKALMRVGVADVIALPLAVEDLETTLATLPSAPGLMRAEGNAGTLVSVLGSIGGAGASTIVSHAACALAERMGETGNGAVLIDLDVQFGADAHLLGLPPSQHSVSDLLRAGRRLDGALLRSTALQHASGLWVLPAPETISPVDGIEIDAVSELLRIARSEYDTVLVDLPASWTNWSLSVIARSDLLFLVTQLTVPALRQTRRQLDLLADQGLNVPVRIVANRYHRPLFSAVDTKDAARVLGRPVDHVIADDGALVSAAADQGILLTDIKRNNKVTRDLAKLVETVFALNGE